MVRLGMAVGFALLAGMAAAEEGPALKSQKERTSYALGVDLADKLKKQAVEVDADLVARGLKDALAGQKTLLTQEEVRGTLLALQNELTAHLQAGEVGHLADHRGHLGGRGDDLLDIFGQRPTLRDDVALYRLL